MSLIELLVALAISSILMISMISGTLFVQRFIYQWSAKNKLAEEAAFIAGDLRQIIENARVLKIFADSIETTTALGERNTRKWDGSTYLIKGRNAIAAKIQIDSIRIRKDNSEITQEPTLIDSYHNYKLCVALKDQKGNHILVTSLIRDASETAKMLVTSERNSATTTNQPSR